MSDARLLLLLAREDDASIDVLRQQAGKRLVHASMADLTRAGWRYVGGCPEHATAHAGGRTLAAKQIAAVLCRVPVVAPEDLQTLHAEDREYAAAEMTAFLRAWLMQFQGVRCNEPSWMSLAGPEWHALQWRRLVTRLGVPVIDEASHTPALSARCETATATVSGGQVFGVAEPILTRYALCIARAVKARLLTMRFVHDDRWRFASADPRPELDESIAAALLRDVLEPRAGKNTVAHHSHAGVCA